MVWKKNKSTELPETLPDMMLTGEKVFLRPPKEEDWQEWHDVRGRNQMRLKPFEPTWPPNALSKDFFERRLRKQIADWHRDHAQFFLMFKASDASLIGGININSITRGVAQFANLGYWIDGEHEGKGYMSEGMRLIKSHCFTALDLHRINAYCILENKRSQKLLMACGFEIEGKAKNYLKIDNKWQDHVLFGTCIEDWRAAQEA